MQATKGFTFTDSAGAGNTCSAANLHTLIDSAAFSNMLLDDFLSTERPVYVSTSTPTGPAVGQLWWKLNANSGTLASNGYNIHLLLAYNGTVWTPIANGTTMTNRSALSLGNGVAAILDEGNDNSISFAASNAELLQCIGAVQASLASGDSGPITTNGLVVSALGGTTFTPGFWVKPITGLAGGFNSINSATVATAVCGRILKDLGTISGTHICAWYFSGIAKVT